MSQFSAGLRISGVDDFMRPEKECVVLKNDLPKPRKEPSLIQVHEDGSLSEVNKEGKTVPLSTTKISLSDCLACSGCVTTAETVLIESQGIEEMLKQLKQRTVVVSISAQSCASIAVRYGMSYSKCFSKLITLFTQLGAKYVMDCTVGENISLMQTASEFVEKKIKEFKRRKIDDDVMWGVSWMDLLC